MYDMILALVLITLVVIIYGVLYLAKGALKNILCPKEDKFYVIKSGLFEMGYLLFCVMIACIIIVFRGRRW